jgi:hypothetical protein
MAGSKGIRTKQYPIFRLEGEVRKKSAGYVGTGHQEINSTVRDALTARQRINEFRDGKRFGHAENRWWNSPSHQANATAAAKVDPVVKTIFGPQ